MKLNGSWLSAKKANSFGLPEYEDIFPNGFTWLKGDHSYSGRFFAFYFEGDTQDGSNIHELIDDNVWEGVIAEFVTYQDNDSGGTVLMPKRRAIKAANVVFANTLLHALSHRSPLALPQFEIDDVLRYWMYVSRFATSLIARRKYAQLRFDFDEEAETATCVWQPVIVDDDFAVYEELLANFPPRACAFVPRSEDLENPVFLEPKAILDDFIQSTIVSTIASFSDSSNFDMIDKDNLTVTEKIWLRMLSSKDGSVRLPKRNRKDIITEITLGLDNAYKSTFRKNAAKLLPCIRLDYAFVQNDQGKFDGNTRWTIVGILQPEDDPSLMLTSALIEKLTDKERKSLESRYGINIRQTYAYEMHRIGFSELIDDALEIGVEEVYDFLTRRMERLREQGVLVLMPVELESYANITMRASTKRAASNTKGIMTMQSLVDLDWSVILEDSDIDITDFAVFSKLKVPMIMVDKKWFMLRDEDLEKLKTLGESRKKQNRQKLHFFDSLRIKNAGINPETGFPITTFESDASVAELIAKIENAKNIDSLPTPDRLVGTLRPYQNRGFNWLLMMTRLGLGSCLADEMGLGKTVQTIALLLEKKRVNTDLGAHSLHLLICPTSVMWNWEQELQRFAPSLHIKVHYGVSREQSSLANVCSDTNVDVLITTYGLTLRDQEILANIDFDLVILDEAQNIKNHLARQTKAIKTFSRQASLALTGTPIENRLSELWSIMDFLNPGYLGNYTEFDRTYAKPIERDDNKSRAQALKRICDNFILRRLKKDPDIAPDLPDKIENTEICELTIEQASLYEAVAQQALMQIESAQGISRSGIVLKSILRFKQICDHPSLYLKDKIPQNQRSGKMQRLMGLVEQILQDGAKTVIFTQFTNMNHMIASAVRQEFGINVLTLEGSDKQEDRKRSVELFTRKDYEYPVFVVALKAGGTGLNLTEATHVIHYDRWWNPAVENQATDRAHRIGQHNTVFVHKFTCKGTIEEKIDAIISTKNALSDTIITGVEQSVTQLSTEELRELFSLRDGGILMESEEEN